MAHRPLLAALLLAACPAPVRAAGPCGQALQKFCGDLDPGQGRIKKCLQDHEAELPPACKARVAADRAADEGGAKRKSAAAGFHEVCDDDIQTLCPDLKGAELARCMNENRASFSDDCKAFLERLKKRRRKARQ
jgi:hypothetical protein